MNKPSSVYVTYVASTAGKVWQALTDPEFTRQYWGKLSIISDWQAGSSVQCIGEGGGTGWEGVVLQAEAPRILSYTFHMLMSEAHRSEQPSRVTFELELVQSVVRLTLTHDQLEPGSSTFETTRYGWPAIMSSLKSLLETGSALPFSRLGFAPSQREPAG
jgi:uncharacterized protein YndB with AHSA1/START domain